ncbi:MAG: BamA/TamA family outer membrane protein [Candidatus Zixiibacteriota bacterium]
MRRLLAFTFIIALATIVEAQPVDRSILRWARNRPIKEIVIDGNQYFSDGRIRKHLYSRTRDFWLALKGDRRSRVQPETRQRDTLEVKYLYLTNGFLDVHVQHSYALRPGDSAAVVNITIAEGPQFFVGSTHLQGGYDRRFQARLLEILSKLKPGEPANLFQLKDTETAMKAFLANRGHPYARIEYAIDPGSLPSSCRIVYNVESDSLVHFGNVIVEVANPLSDGTNRYGRTDEYDDYEVALRELKIKPGAVYRRDDILESQRRLFESGYFTTFQLSPAPNSRDSLNPEFLLRVSERKSAYMTLRLGAAQSEVRDLVWDVSAGAGQRNVWGSRTIEGSLDLSFSAGQDTRLLDNRIRASFQEPWFVGTRTRMVLALDYQPRLKDPVKDFDKESWAVSVAFSRWFGRKLRANLGLEYRKVKLSDIPESEIPLVKEQEGISARRKVYLTLRRDSRDDLFVPRRGSVTEFSGDVYGGFLRGDADFFKLQASWSRYRQVWPGWIAATRVRGAWAEAYSDTRAVPVDQALYLGGASTVRGIEENRLGPLDADGAPLGANYTLVFNQEFRWKTLQFLTVLPLVGDLMTEFPIWQSVFVDVGNAFQREQAIRLNNLAVAYGLGFQLVTPAGPIRVDYAEQLAHDDFDYSHRWHFTILYAF